MKNFKTINVINLIIIGCTFVLTGCSQNDSASSLEASNINTSAKIQRRASTGEDIFKSLFFGIGNNITEVKQLEARNNLIKDLAPDAKAEYETKMTTLTNIIKDSDPNFFINFKKDITSGNQQIVKNAIDNSTVMLYSKISQVLPDFNNFANRLATNYCGGDFDQFGGNGGVERYINNFTTRLPRNSFNGLLEQNIISDNANRGCSFAFGCVAVIALYFAAVVHNTVGLSAIIYLKFALWGPSLSSPSGGGGSGGSGGGSGPSPIMSDIPTDTNNASLKMEVLVNELTLYYA